MLEASVRRDFWARTESELLDGLQTEASGLTDIQARERYTELGPNLPRQRQPVSTIRILVRQFANPIVLILIGATLVSWFLGDQVDALIILAIIIASSLLGFWQEHNASNAVAALLAQVSVRVEVVRDGKLVSVPIESVVPGDIVELNAGDVIPADCRILAADMLLVNEASLTGEAFPREKVPGQLPVSTPLNQRSNAAFMGSHVVSGRGKALAVVTGADTTLGHMSSALDKQAKPTSFRRGIREFGYLLVRLTAILVTLIFAVNVFLNRPIVESLLFSLALAVGLTPQLLPAIVTVSLATGARQMAKSNVIVKRLDAIEEVGSMTTLCTDKTGTITEGSLSLARATDPRGADSQTVLRLGWLNARLQTGYSNPLDQALLSSSTFSLDEIMLLDEIPYDFTRKRLSILIQDLDGTVLITKGALESILSVCTDAATGAGPPAPLDEVRPDIERQFESFSAQGQRVIGVAVRRLQNVTTCSADHEQEMTFVGLLSFNDPP